MATAEKRTDVFYYTDNTWYKGDCPKFYDENQFPGTRILKENYQAIKKEILDHFQAANEEFSVNYTPYAMNLEGWKSVNLYSYFLEYPDYCARFPVTTAVVNQIPGMCLAMISVIEPHTVIPPHIGDTDGTVRHHLAIRIPGQLPDVGFRVKRESREWLEGDVFSFCIAHRHLAWNKTDQPRVILMVDTIREDLMPIRYEVASKTLATIVMKACVTRFPLLKKMPRPLTAAIHWLFGWAFRLVLFLQRRFGIHLRKA